jgi:hypothetical protein
MTRKEMPGTSDAADLPTLIAEMAEAEARMRHPIPTGMEVIWSLIEAAIGVGGLVGGLLYLAHLIWGWPS